MTKSQHLWLKAARLLSDPVFFDSERERVLTTYPMLNSHGLGQLRRRVSSAGGGGHSGRREMGCIPDDPALARNELRAGGRHEKGIRNTLEYFVEGRVSLSYRLKGCGWARRFNGPSPPKHSSYYLKRQAESYLRKMDESKGITGNDRYTSNGAFVCAALMAGLRIWSYKNSINPDLRLGRPWAVAGLRPEDYNHPEDEYMAKFWRWALQQDTSDPDIEDFVADTVDLLYSGADLEKLQESLAQACLEARNVYNRLRHQFGFEISDKTVSSRLGFMAGQIEVPDDFDNMGSSEIEKIFRGSENETFT